MAKIKPYKSSGKFDVAMGALDVIGMTDIPVVSQLAEAGSAVGSLATGDLVGFGLSVGSMIPIAGKTCEIAKATRRAQRLANTTVDVVKNADKIADTTKAVGKNAKLGEITITKKIKDFEAGGTETIKKATKAKPTSAAKPAPASTKAKSPKIEGPKEVQQAGSKLDISDGVTNNIDSAKWYQHLDDLAKPKPTNRGITHQNYYGYQSNPPAGNISWNTGKHYPFKFTE